ncbi:MAG: LVIVD repeat-containing protein [Candidatus Thorarchaeota archaeon]|jgi:hypothetical protein
MNICLLLFVILLAGTIPSSSANVLLSQDYGPGYQTALRESYAYVTNNFGVAIYDISDQSAPSRVNEFTLGGPAGGIEIDGDTLFIAGLASGLVIADLSESATQPSILAEYIMSDYVTQVSVIGNYAYLVTGFGILQILDISDPNNPEELGGLTLSELTLGLAVYGDTIYISQPGSGLKVVDASNINSLQYNSLVAGTTGARDIQVYGDLLYLARGTSGVDILNVSNSSNPEIIGHFNDGGNSFGLHGDSHYLCIADLLEGIEVLDITDATNPVEHTQYTDAAPHNLIFSERFAYIADQDDEFKIVDFTSSIPEYNESLPPSGNHSSTTTNSMFPLDTLIVPLVISVTLCVVIVVGTTIYRKRK